VKLDKRIELFVVLDEAGEPIEHAGDPVRALDAARPD
jgi:hypothetical protein